MIEARGLSKRYGDKLAVDDLSFTVRPGRVTGFLGPNGASNGDSVVAPSTTRRLIGRFLPHLPATEGVPDRKDLAELTVREREVLAEVGSGLSNTEIAALLHISEATVKTHVGHIMAKLGLRDRIQAVVYAYETGLVRPGAGKQ
jgi:DNA-binding NarL/FixJ family response regulator